MIEIQPLTKNLDTEILIPGSKSYTHRICIFSALSNGMCRISNALKCEDTSLTINALKRLGVTLEEQDADLVIQGTSGKLKGDGEIYLGNCGTGLRLLTAVAALAEGRTVLRGDARMHQRPIEELISGLQQIGIPVRSLFGNGCPPLEVTGKSTISGGRVRLRGDVSSQFISALLILAPLTRDGITIEMTTPPVSRPYIDLTIDLMRQFGVTVVHNGYELFQVPGEQTYRAGCYTVEPDVTNASYFWAAAAITGGKVTVRGISRASKQGDLKFLSLLEAMGAIVLDSSEGITVIGSSLRGIEVDMGDSPDIVPTLAVVAAFAEGVTRIHNVAHLRLKESDRLAAIATELSKMGIVTRRTDDSLVITGGTPQGAEIETYNDHRIAMAFSVAGLKVQGIRIRNHTCVGKSFPTYWAVFDRLYTS
jgi:3-phosphoshikimate 1-carboxyvinyltransferase